MYTSLTQRVLLPVFAALWLFCQTPAVVFAQAKEDKKEVKAVPELETETVTGKKQRWDPKKTHPDVFDPVNSERWRSGFREAHPTEIPDDLKNVDALTRARALKRLIACADGWYYPFSRTAPQSETPGIDIDILREIVKRQGWRLHIVWANTGFNWDYALRTTIDKGYCDFFVGLVHQDADPDMTDHKMVYTRPYVGVGFVLAVQGKAADVKSLTDLKARKIRVGVPMLSPMEDYVRANKMEYELYAKSQGLIDGLLKHDVDAGMIWSGAMAVAKDQYDIEFEVVPDFIPQAGQRWNGVWAIKEKETQLKGFLDEQLGALLKEGKIKTIVESYAMPYFAPFND